MKKLITIIACALGIISYAQVVDISTINYPTVRDGAVNVFAADASTNTIYAGGTFSSVTERAPFAIAFDSLSALYNHSYPRPNGVVNAVLSDKNGGWYIGGSFTKVGDSIRTSFAHINSSGVVTNRVFNVSNGFAAGTVRAMAWYGDTIVMGGLITNVNGTSIISNLNLCKVVPSTGAVDYQNYNNTSASNGVHAVVVRNSDVFVGTGSSFARASLITGNSSSWFQTSSGAVLSIHIDEINNRYFAGGAFTQVDLTGGGFTARQKMAAFNLTNNALLSNTFFGAGGGAVNTITTSGSHIIVGGNNLDAGGYGLCTRFYNRITLALDNTLLTTPVGELRGVVNKLAVNGNSLYIGGLFTRSGFSADTLSNCVKANLVSLDLINWHTQLDSSVFDFGFWDSKVFAGGVFNGRLLARTRLMAFDANSGAVKPWNPSANNTVDALAVNGNNVFIGGTFTEINGQSIPYLGAVNKNTAAIEPLGVTVDNSVGALFSFNNKVFVGGSFSVPAFSLFAINATTLNVDNTFTRTVRRGSTPGNVNAIFAENNRLHVGGRFSLASNAAGSSSVSRISYAVFDIANDSVLNYGANTNTTMGTPVTSTFVSSLIVKGNLLYMSGYFNTVSGTSRAGGVAVMDVSNNNALTSYNPNVGILSTQTVNTIAPINTAVFVGGSYLQFAGNNNNSYFAGLGLSSPVVNQSTSTNNVVNRTFLFGTKMFVGGAFTNIQGRSLPRLAVYELGCAALDAPVNTTSAANQRVCAPNGTAILSASGSGTRRWYNQASGGSILGTGSTYITPAINATTTYYVDDSLGNCISPRTSILVTFGPFPTAVITNLNDTIRSTNPFDSYELRRDGQVVASSNTSGSFVYPVTQCGNYQATFTNIINDCVPLNASVGGVTSGGCNAQATISGASAIFPVRARTTTSPTFVTFTQNPISVSVSGFTCNQLSGQSVTLEMINAVGCRYLSTFTLGFTAVNQVLTSTNGDTLTQCPFTSNIVVVNSLPGGIPTNTTATSALTICSGTSTTLTASGSGTLYWFDLPTGGTDLGSGTSFSTGTLTANKTFYVQSGLGVCSSSRVPVAVTVNAVPTAAISPATVTICSGTSATLTASGGGNYAWSNTGGSNAAATFSPTTNTTYTVTVTNTTNCSATASRLVTVNANPTAVISPTTVAICNGSSATLTAGGGTQYAWSNSGGSNAAATFSPTTNTTYTVTVTAANTCTATASRLVTVNALPSAAINGPTTICSGLSATLTASGGGTYAWSNSLGSAAAVTVSPTTATTYTVTVTNNSCTATASQTVSVQSAPTAVINGASSVCAGSSITLTANGGNTYTWSNGGGNAASATFSPTTTTTYTVTASLGAGCTATATKTITIKQPTSGSYNQTICFGQSVLFNGISRSQSGAYLDTLVNLAGCDSFLTLNLTVRPQITGSIAQTVCFGGSTTFNGATLTQSGMFKDTLTSVTGCDSILTLTFTVRPRIATSITQPICNGSAITFNGQTITAAGAYLDTLTSVNGCDSFITLNVTIAQATAATISKSACGSYRFGGNTLTASGTYLDTIQNTAGCDSVITLNLTINQATASTMFDTICNGDSYSFGVQTLNQSGAYNRTITNVAGCDSVITLHLFVRSAVAVTASASGFNLSASAGFVAYQWKLNGSAISGANTQTYTAVANGTYTVEVTDANGCKGTSNTVNVTGVGIENLSNISLTIYPNPATDIITIETDEQVTGVELFSAIGQKINVTTNAKQQINISDLAAGAYSLIIHTTNGSIQKRFVKE